MYMITFDKETRIVTSVVKINPKYALSVLPDGAAYVASPPEGRLFETRYLETGEYETIVKEDDYAENQN